jgi:hypothetical protein
LGILLFFSLNKGGIFLYEVEEWCCNGRKVSAKHVMIPYASQESLYLFKVMEGPRIFPESSDFGRVYCDTILRYSYPKEVYL